MVVAFFVGYLNNTKTAASKLSRVKNETMWFNYPHLPLDSCGKKGHNCG